MSKYRLQTILFVLTSFMLGCNEFIVVGVISDISQSLKVSVATVGYLVTIFATTFAVSTPFITVLTNRFSRYKTLMVLMGIFLVGNTLSGFATSYGMLLLARMMTAIVAGAIESFIIAFANDIAPHDKRAVLIAWISAGFSIASVIGVPIGVAISTADSWHTAFHVISIITLVTYVLLAWLLPRHVPQTKGGVKDQLVFLTDRRVYLGIAVNLFMAATMYAYYTYIRPLITTSMGFSLTSLNWLLFVLGIMSIISNRLSGTLAERNGLRQLPWFYVADMALLLILPVALNSQVLGFGVLLILTLIVTIAGAPIQIHFLDVAAESYPQATMLASSVSPISFNIGISVGSATASLMLSQVGLQNVSLGAAGYALISLILVVILNRVMATYHQSTVLEK
ncbi:MFS transporter [Levilactobacillus hammesii]|uniref:Arabinose efflux permease n=1 Tax=Levilactobacillus hammesii DSM 16381 TaxID=1423753 RepID=A0A0R1UPQ5_9LACO|nr:MFS transporter [Levilactobacillus hammesii]KRL93395.1 arabinose efflux permease [Levilactobacillus hammesii DSM 16381]